MTARLLVLIARIKYYFQCVESTFYTGKSILIQAGGISETVDKLCLLVLCSWGISKCSARLFEMQTTQKAFTIFSSLCWFYGSPRLCAFRKFARLWSLQYLFTLWRILHNPSALSGEVSVANRFRGSCCTWQKQYWLLRNHQRLFDRKRFGGQQRSLSFLSFLPCCERLLLTGKIVVWSPSKYQLSNFARFGKNLSSLGLYKSNFENNSLKALLYDKNVNFETGARFSMFTQTAC